MKVIAKLILQISFLFVFGVCNEHPKTTRNDGKVSTDQADDLKLGGVYLFQNDDKSYYLTKILAIDDFAAHVRTYSDIFKTKPTDINCETLKVLIGHAPIDKNTFLNDRPELLKVEKVKESELEGYKMYLDAMSK